MTSLERCEGRSQLRPLLKCCCAVLRCAALLYHLPAAGNSAAEAATVCICTPTSATSVLAVHQLRALRPRGTSGLDMLCRRAFQLHCRARSCRLQPQAFLPCPRPQSHSRQFVGSPRGMKVALLVSAAERNPRSPGSSRLPE